MFTMLWNFLWCNFQTVEVRFRLKMQGWVFWEWNCRKSNDGERRGWVCVFNSLLRKRIHGKIPPPRHDTARHHHRNAMYTTTPRQGTTTRHHWTAMHGTTKLQCNPRHGTTRPNCNALQGAEHSARHNIARHQAVRECNQCNVKPNERFHHSGL